MNLFTYGTLMFPEIWEAVVGDGEVQTTQDSLAGFEIFKFEGYDFPGIILTEESQSTVPGVIYHNLSASTIERLDRYEDAAYFRDRVRTESGVACDAYIVKTSHHHLLSRQRWTSDWFDQHCRESYFAALCQ